ncbi:MAG: flagellar motor protein MotB [Salinibacter sp.]
MRWLSVLVGLAAALAGLSGCVAGLSSASSTARVDSLQAETATLRARLRRLRDSLQLRSDVATGQYGRDLRVLKDRLNRLTYEARTLRDGGRTVRVLPADSLFEPGTATLTPIGKTRLRVVLSHLQAAYPSRVVRVEGHSDNMPLSEELQKQYPTNWELAAARATTVVRHLIANSDLDPAQFLAVSYGATDPVASNETARGRRRNRRVRIAVLPPPRDYSRPFETSW